MPASARHYAALLACALLAGLSAAAQARVLLSFEVNPSTQATLTVDEQGLVQIQVDEDAPQTLYQADPESRVKVFDRVDLNHDGNTDLSMGSSEKQARLFIYQPDTRLFAELPYPESGLCGGFSMPEFDEAQPRVIATCFEGMTELATEIYRVLPGPRVAPERLRVPLRSDPREESIDAVIIFNSDGVAERGYIDGSVDPLGADGLVKVSRAALYEAPDLARPAAVQAKAGDRLQILGASPGGWLKVSGDDGQARWVRFEDLLLDGYAMQEPSTQPLRLGVFDYFGKSGEELADTFTLTVSNTSSHPVDLKAPQIFLLFTAEDGRRIVHALYHREAGTLASGAVLTWDDNAVQIMRRDDGSPRYVIFDNEAYPTFFPALADGNYRLAAMLVDPALPAPLYSNEVGFAFPFKAEEVEVLEADPD